MITKGRFDYTLVKVNIVMTKKSNHVRVKYFTKIQKYNGSS